MLMWKKNLNGKQELLHKQTFKSKKKWVVHFLSFTSTSYKIADCRRDCRKKQVKTDITTFGSTAVNAENFQTPVVKNHEGHRPTVHYSRAKLRNSTIRICNILFWAQSYNTRKGKQKSISMTKTEKLGYVTVGKKKKELSIIQVKY